MAEALPEKARLVVMSGPSGAGKTSICERLVRDYRCSRAITATTRSPRDGERDGVDYFFLSPEEFRRGIEEGDFLEHAEVHGALYGTPLAPLRARLQQGETVFLVIDVQGAAELMDRGTEATYVFIETPDLETLEERLRTRGTDDPKEIARRLETARRELECRGRYAHRVVNEELEEAVAETARILGIQEKK